MNGRRGSLVVGVAGGTGSGKTTVVQRIVDSLAPGPVARLHHDSYYRDLGHLAPEARDRVNFDHPDALESDLLARHLDRLREGRSVRVPVYDFATHTRRAEPRRVAATPVVIVEGILLLAEPEVRRRLDVKIYVDTDADLRFIRRLRRDLEERGRTLEAVIRQYTETVRPMHLEFVEPSKRYADLILPMGGRNDVAIEMLSARLRSVLAGATSDSG